MKFDYIILLSMLVLSACAYAQPDSAKIQQHTQMVIDAATHGDAALQWALGNKYLIGTDSFHRDYNEAMNWFLRAADQGYTIAFGSVGLMYCNGMGVMQDFREAARWFTMPGADLSGEQENALGMMYENGFGVDRNYEKAFAAYNRSFDMAWGNNNIAEDNLGRMYENGLGTLRDYKKAFDSYSEAADNGDAYAANNLGLMYKAGRGVAQNDEDAVKWFQKASEAGNMPGKGNLGIMLYEGRGTTRDIGRGSGYIKEAASRNIPAFKAYLKDHNIN